jgi:hypothetical protein
MESMIIHTKDELFLKVSKQIEKAKMVISESRKTVELAKKRSDCLKKEYDTFPWLPKKG